MRRLALAAALACGLGNAALAQNPYAGSFGGSSSLVIGTTAITGGATTQVLFNLGGVVSSDAGFTYAGSSGQVSTGGALFVTGNLTVNSTSLLAWSGRGGMFGPADGTVQFTNNAGTNRINLAVSGGNPGIGTFNGRIAAPNLTLSSLTTGTNADFLCLSAGGDVLIQTSPCTISTLAHKPDWKSFEGDAIASIKRLEVGTFHFDDVIANQPDPNARSLQIGLNAENVASVIPEAAVYENDMRTPKSYRQEGMIALLVKGMQQQQTKIDALKTEISTMRSVRP
jgi:hypothetical protein